MSVCSWNWGKLLFTIFLLDFDFFLLPQNWICLYCVVPVLRWWFTYLSEMGSVLWLWTVCHSEIRQRTNRTLWRNADCFHSKREKKSNFHFLFFTATWATHNRVQNSKVNRCAVHTKEAIYTKNRSKFNSVDLLRCVALCVRLLLILFSFCFGRRWYFLLRIWWRQSLENHTAHGCCRRKSFSMRQESSRVIVAGLFFICFFFRTKFTHKHRPFS